MSLKFEFKWATCVESSKIAVMSEEKWKPEKCAHRGGIIERNYNPDKSQKRQEKGEVSRSSPGMSQMKFQNRGHVDKWIPLSPGPEEITSVKGNLEWGIYSTSET
jgi:hypothetical protein